MADNRMLSSINVTPFVDVMLVLLVIFMVTTPLMETGIDVNLPEVEAGSVEGRDEPIIVSVDKKGDVFINKKKVSLSKLRGNLTAIVKRRKDKTVYLRADEAVPYGKVARTMATIRSSGIKKIAMITETPTGGSNRK